MLHPSSAQIFLAEAHPTFQTKEQRSIHILPKQTLVKSLIAAKDETLATGESADYFSEGSLILIPIVGTITVALNGNEYEIDCGNVFVINSPRRLTIYNPYPGHLVNYLVIDWQKSIPPETHSTTHTFDLNTHKNELVEALCLEGMKIYAAKMEMRQETILDSDSQDQSSFCFVVQGSFEIEGRLLHEKDALTIWNTDSLNIESLGKESVILIIQLIE